jgi:hypothetical protein
MQYITIIFEHEYFALHTKFILEELEGNHKGLPLQINGLGRGNPLWLPLIQWH